MDTEPHVQPPTPSATGGTAQGQETFVSLHTAVVLLAAVLIGLVVGGLTVLSRAPVAAAVIAGVSSAGGSIPVLRTLIR
ncbi:hypothetical protein [Streptomyces sp. NPDC056796]|uniref:hypothetical protein n=1 Tax=unclassified Streptomyces TaxID=2593676 RepID=UPI0036BF2683